MATTKIDLARQAIGRIFIWGSSSAGGDALVTIEKGTQPTSTVVLDVKASANVGGDLNVAGNLNITGAINEQNVTNLSVADKTITLNKGGASGSDSASGVQVEAGGAIVAALQWLSGKWTVGNGSTQTEIADISTAQTLSNKTLASPALNGTPTAPTAAAGNNSTQIATTAFVAAAITLSNAYFHAVAVTGTQDGTNKTFTVGSALAAGSEQIYLNGQMLTPGSSNDYILSGTTLTFQAAFPAPLATDVLRAYGVY